jgi:DNA-binding protein
MKMPKLQASLVIRKKTYSANVVDHVLAGSQQWRRGEKKTARACRGKNISKRDDTI